MIKLKNPIYFVSYLILLLVLGGAFSVSAGPLHKAVKSGDVKKVNTLIAQGNDINEKKTFSKKTPLIYAAENELTEITEILLTKGAKTEEKDTLGDTALLKAANIANLEILQILLTKGANVDATNNNGDTAMLILAKTGSVKAVELMLKYNAKPDVKNADGETALVSAISRGYKQIEQLLDPSIAH